MQGWLESVAGPDYASALMWTVVALIALLIILVAVRIVRGLTFGTFVAGGRNRKARLAVMDATAVDSHRRLVLVRRDDVEHLILIGGPTDVVVEQNIRLLPPVRRPAMEEAGDYVLAMPAPGERPAVAESHLARPAPAPQPAPRAEAPQPPLAADGPQAEQPPLRDHAARQPQAAPPPSPVSAQPPAPPPAAPPVRPAPAPAPRAPITAAAPLRPSPPPPAVPIRPAAPPPPRPASPAPDSPAAIRPAPPLSTPIQRANLVPPRPVAPPAAAAAAPAVAAPAPAPQPPAPQAPEPVAPAAESRKQDLDEALFEELEITLEKDNLKSAVSDVDRALDDEMSKLLSEFAEKKP